MASILTLLKESLLLCDYFSWQASSAMSSILPKESDVAVSSSAYIVTCVLLRANGKSMYSEIKKGPM